MARLLAYPSTRTIHWTEYWVSEEDQYGDIIDYTFQGPRVDRAKAEAEFAAPFQHADAVAKSLEEVRSWGSESEGVQEREYTTLKERAR